MPFDESFPIFHTQDIERLAAFCCDQLGFERGYRFPDEGDVAFLVLVFVFVLVACGYSLWRVWRREHTYGY